MAGETPPAERPGRPRGRTPRRRNPLRRRTDALRLWFGLGVPAAVLVVTPVTAVVAADLAHRHYDSVARHQAQTRHETTATLLRDAPRRPEAGSDEDEETRRPAQVRVVTREGRTRITTADVPPGMPAGSPLRIWVTAEGEATEAPLTGRDVRSRSMGWALLAALGVVLAGAATHAAVRHGLSRRDLAAWEAAWARTAPDWTPPT
ncbi:Rv1733c family protein [Streptomyces sp. enrichment culture]|uniref:Rv1733c family protein n=1 Tax=Streptomyces sp. enrichment culture TaxID=1795815 RepID=UPI003F5518B2